MFGKVRPINSPSQLSECCSHHVELYQVNKYLFIGIQKLIIFLCSFRLAKIQALNFLQHPYLVNFIFLSSCVVQVHVVVFLSLH